jgi:hypothetical protein
MSPLGYDTDSCSMGAEILTNTAYSGGTVSTDYGQ